MNLLCFSAKAYSLKLYLICFYINFKSLKLYLILNWCYTKLWIRIWNQKFDSVRCKYKHYYISIKLIVFKESNVLKKITFIFPCLSNRKKVWITIYIGLLLEKYLIKNLNLINLNKIWKSEIVIETVLIFSLILNSNLNFFCDIFSIL